MLRGFLLEGAQLIVEQGLDKVSVADIAAQAECSTGAVYHHFKDKDAVFRAIYERMEESWMATGETVLEPERWDGATILDILRSYLRLHFTLMRKRPFHKPAALEVAKVFPDLAERYVALEEKSREALLGFFMGRKGEVGRDQPERAIRYALDQCNAIAKLALTRSREQRDADALNDQELIDETLASIHAYLKLETTRS